MRRVKAMSCGRKRTDKQQKELGKPKKTQILITGLKSDKYYSFKLKLQMI